MHPAAGAVATALVLAMTPTLVQASASAAPRLPVRIRATVETFDHRLLTVKTEKGDHLTLELTARTGFAIVEPRRLSDIAVNAYVGVAADHKLHATRVYIFPATMRGAGEGHFPGREGRDSATVNAMVTAIAPAPDGETVTLHFKSKASGREGSSDIDVGAAVPVAAFVPGDASVLKPGAETVTVVQKDGDGDLHALEIVAGRHNFKPPM